MDYEILLKKAQEVSKKAYVPYSKFPVGACVFTKSGNTYVGCNVENSSYGLTMCAERNAIASAVASGDRDIVAIALYSPKMEDCMPCGACRQVIFEFQKDDEIEIVTQVGSEIKIRKINQLLPAVFDLRR